MEKQLNIRKNKMKTITLQSLLLSIILTSCNSSKVNNNLDGSIDLNNFETVTIESDAKKLTHLICLGKQLKTEIESVKEELSSKEAELKAKQDAKFAILGNLFQRPLAFNPYL